MIKMQMIGFIGRDAVMRQHGIENVLTWSTAHTDKYKDTSGVQHQKTTWVSCSWWVDGQSKVGQYLKKGTLVYLEGFPEAKMWENQDGKKACGITMRVVKLELLGGKREEHNDNAPQQQPKVDDEGFTPYSEEPPF